MTLEQQVCSLELAKRLKELGVKQEALWWWRGDKLYSWRDDPQSADFESAAFTVAELGEMCFGWTVTRSGNIKAEWYEVRIHGKVSVERTMADAMGEMIAHLLENNIITLP